MAADFFQRQADARRSSRMLVGLFGLAVLGILVAVNMVVMFFIVAGADGAWSPGAMAVTSLIVLLLIGGAVALRHAELRKGGRVVAESLGGTRVSEDARDFQLVRLRNVVEEMAIASGVPVPAIYVLEQEDGINAFAAGYTPADAAIAVTRGALDRLSREELQGVVAHEYSHILNGDMRLNIRLMGWLFGILFITIIGQRIMQAGAYTSVASNNRNNGGAVALGLALLVIGGIGTLFGHMIKSAVSRSREYLADASAVQFTRQSDGLAGALKKIGGVPQGSQLHSAEAEDVSHMLFSNGLRSRMFATHPPILKRIKALEPGFNASAFKAEARQLANRYDGRNPDDGSMGLAGAAAPLAPSVPQATAAPTTDVAAIQSTGPRPEALLAQAGTLGLDHVRLARSLRETLPPMLSDAAHTPSGALAVMVALLLDEEPGIRAVQRDALVKTLGDPVASAADGLRDAVRMLHPLQRSPLAAISLPALRRLPMARLHALRELVPTLIHADGRIALHEYVLGAMLETQLDDALRPRRRVVRDKLELDACAEDVALLFQVMAGVGHPDAGAAGAAYNTGIARVLNAPPPWNPRTDWHEHLDEALQRLDALTPERKRTLLEGLAVTMLHQHRVTPDEYELLRSVCAALHCPLPPLLPVG